MNEKFRCGQLKTTGRDLCSRMAIIGICDIEPLVVIDAFAELMEMLRARESFSVFCCPLGPLLHPMRRPNVTLLT